MRGYCGALWRQAEAFMTKSELIALLAERHPHLLSVDVDMATRHVLDQLGDALARGERIEVRGFGSFALRYRRPRLGRNPKTGTAVALPGRYSPHFKPGIGLRERVNGRVAESPTAAGM
jgi:integration host factor subunit beta